MSFWRSKQEWECSLLACLCPRQGSELLSACWPGLTIQGYFFPAHKERDNLKVTQSMVPALSLVALMQLCLNAHELPGIALHPRPPNLAQNHDQDQWLQQDWRHTLLCSHGCQGTEAT